MKRAFTIIALVLVLSIGSAIALPLNTPSATDATIDWTANLSATDSFTGNYDDASNTIRDQRGVIGQSSGQPGSPYLVVESGPEAFPKRDAVSVVPEPGTLILLGFGLAGGAWLRRRKA